MRITEDIFSAAAQVSGAAECVSFKGMTVSLSRPFKASYV